MTSVLQVLCGLVAVLFAIYYYLHSCIYNYWKSRGVPGPAPTILTGNFTPVVIKKSSIAEHITNLYKEYKHEPLFGIYEGTTPVLVINDLELIRDVFIRDFSLFAHRGFRVYPKVEPLIEHLFALEPERWRPMRMQLLPVFTSGKLKDMIPLIVECSKNLEKYLEKVSNIDEPVEFRELAAKYTTDVIGSCALGIEMSALSDENSKFREMGRRLFEPGLRQMSRDVLREFAPAIYRIIGGFLQAPGVDDFLINMVRDTMNYRMENNIVRPDFINTLIQLKKHPEKMENVELTDRLLAAQAFVFFVAGFETSSVTMAHSLYELALRQDVQDKLRAEIRESFEKFGEVLTHDQLKKMSYLDKVFKETLRKHPIVPTLTRQAMENYTFRGTKVTIEKGTNVWVFPYAIQHDPDFYPNPEIFDPERFEGDAASHRHPMTYLPFGDGPRNCIGTRFAHYQTKIGLITILQNHKVDKCEKTVIPFKTDPRLFLATLKDGVHLKISKLEQ